MKFKMELLILPIVLLFIYFRPTFLVNFSSTILGKLLMLGLIVLATLKNKWYGVSAAILSIIITEMGMIEGMDDMGGDDMGGDDMGGDDMGGDDMDMTDKGILASMDEMNLDEQGGDEGGEQGGDMGMENDMVSDDAIEETSDEDMSGEKESFSLINNFGITGGNERLYMDEKLRAKSSNDCLY